MDRSSLSRAGSSVGGDPLPADGGYAVDVLDEFRNEGVDDIALAAQLQKEGAEAFSKSWGGLLARIASIH